MINHGRACRSFFHFYFFESIMFQNAVLFMLGAAILVGTCILMRRSFFPHLNLKTVSAIHVFHGISVDRVCLSEEG